MQTHPIVLGTAGHIDHGKTALVRALTGIDTDRLKVEKERGITTELGFAHLDLGERRFGLVDVPGHERFIKSMVAGAGGLDLVCLVIAADEGVMPQTQEHLDICELLGVRRGVVALTKSDLVDEDWIALVTDDVRQRLAGTFLAESAIVPLSARTGAGLDDLRAELIRMTDELPTRDADGPFRLPLDRVFTIHGFGTVVTGTALSGAVAVGDTVVVHPRGLTAKVRGLEVHGEHVERATAGMRCAVNLTGVAREELRRGDMVSHPDAIEPSHIVDATFRYLGTSRAPLPRRSRVLLHHATAQLMATVVLADRDELAPGEQALVQLRLDATTPLAALPGDRFIARGFVVQEHYGTTIGGGEIVRVHAPKVKRSSADAAAAIALIAEAQGDDRVALEVRGSKVAGISLAELARRLGIAEDELGQRLARLIESGDVAVAGEGAGAVYMHAESIARLEQTAGDAVAAFLQDNPEREGIGKEELRGRLPRSVPQRIYELVLEALSRRGAIEVDRDLVRAKRGRAAGPAIGKREEQILERYRGWGVEAPRLKELPGELGMGDKELRGSLDKLLGSGALVRIKSDYYIAADVADELRTKLVAHLDANGQITPAEWKDITNASRKFSIPLAEHFDAEKLTLRIGDIRKRRG